MIMDYESIITGIMADFVHPCIAEIPAGYYRRIRYELYPENYPAVGVEWETEIIPIGTHVTTTAPYGMKSEPLPYDPDETETGILVQKIGTYFDTQSDIDDYIISIGATKLDGNDWYGADLSKSSLFKHPLELELYQIENSGGYWTEQGARADQRIRQVYNQTTKAFTDIDYGWNGNRIAYMKHDENEDVGHVHMCMYTGMAVNANADTSIPPIPDPVPVSVGMLPSEISRMSAFRAASIGCIPVVAGFPYSNISDAMLSAWNTTRNSFKLMFEDLAGIPLGTGGISTMFDNLSIAMEEITSGAVAMSQQVWQAAIKQFKQIVSSAFSIVGGAWNLIKSFLPTVTILGVSIDINELVFGDSPVQYLKQSFAAVVASGAATSEQVISSIYAAIGSAYDYSVEYVKSASRDIVDAVTALYDWCITMFQNGCVALVDLYGRMMELWSMPPIIPNPIWVAVRAIRAILMQIKPLDIILGGNFPGFTAADLYQQAQEIVKQKIDQAYDQIRDLYEQANNVYQDLIRYTQERDALVRKYNQYLKRMWETVTDQATAAYESAIVQANEVVEQTKAIYDSINQQIDQIKETLSDTYSMAMQELKNLPLISQINVLLGYCGIDLDSLVQTYEVAISKAKSLYRDVVDSSRSFKDTCKIIYNQICTLALSKVTQYMNKLLSLIGMVVQFPTISVCVPMIKYS
ncbi:hypothetical protein POP12_060 [Pectobacterium phage POP12]|nr:hypothetical protein POP12_060 [Pectobacterium phage POP12]